MTITLQQDFLEHLIYVMYLPVLDMILWLINLLLQETYPSWLYPVKMGATTIWERWDGEKPDSSFQTPGMNSFNHYAYGAIGDWMYRNITGIDNYGDAAGYKKISIRPHTGGNLIMPMQIWKRCMEK